MADFVPFSFDDKQRYGPEPEEDTTDAWSWESSKDATGEPLLLKPPPCMNVYVEDGDAYMWFRLIPDGFDLSPEEYGDRSVGHRPRWIDETISESGIDSLLEVRWDSDHSQWLSFAIENGIAPGQPFCMAVAPPYHTVSHSMDGTEYDTEYSAVLATMVPKDPLSAARSWDRFLKSRQECFEMDAASRKRILDRAWALRRDWYLRLHHTGRYNDEGIHIHLCSLQRWAGTLASVYRSKDTNQDKALEELLREVQKRDPIVTLDFLKSLRKNW